MRILVITLFLLIQVQPVLAGYLLSIDEAEKLLIDTNIEIKVKKTDLRKSDADVTGARLLPNPEAKYLLETIGGGQNDKETTYSVVQPIDFAGKRSKRIEAAEKKRDAHKLFLEYEIAGLLSQMKQLYYRILLLGENKKVIEHVITISGEAERKIAARVKAGDAAEVELMKLTSEKHKFVRILEELKIDLRTERKRLALMLRIQDMDFDLEDKFQYKSPLPDIKETSEKALNTRSDIKAQATLVDAMSASLSLSKREATPSLAVEAGYKRWMGGFDGFVFGLTIPLPLFDRNQGKIAAAQAEKEKQSLNYELMKRYASSEIAILMEKTSHLQARISDILAQLEKTREVTKISSIAYEEGEISLIEVLDAVRSEKELSMEYNNAVYEYWASVFEMERATSTRILNTGDKL